MGLELKMQRNEGAEVDFTGWGFDDGVEALKPFISQMLNNAISVVFSKDGARSRLSVDVPQSEADDLRIKCEIEFEDFEAYASASVSLRELITYSAGLFDEDGDRQKMANALRSLADSIAPSAKQIGGTRDGRKR